MLRWSQHQAQDTPGYQHTSFGSPKIVALSHPFTNRVSAPDSLRFDTMQSLTSGVSCHFIESTASPTHFPSDFDSSPIP